MELINKIGRRKNAVARVYLEPGQGSITINGKEVEKYFPSLTLQYQVNVPFEVTETKGQYNARITVNGGGITGQAGAVKMAIARALAEINADFRAPLKKNGLFTRDSRMVERKKSGQKKARKRFQFSKR